MARPCNSSSVFKVPVSKRKHMMKMKGKEELTPVEKLFWYTFHVVGFFWNVFSFYPWYIFSGNNKQKRLGHQQGKSTTGKPEGPYRSIEAICGLTSNWKGLETLDQIFKYVYSSSFFMWFLYFRTFCSAGRL